LKTNSLSVREKGPASALAVRVALYARVSTAEQSCELQLLDLHDYAARQGWEIAGVYQDIISGSKSDRPALNRLREDARAKRFDCLLV
jgi:DNA invertase Pin-like site-specific DNA recombinase